MAQKDIYHYYLVSDLNDRTTPMYVYPITEETNIPENLRFKLTESGVFIDPGVNIYELPSGREYISQGENRPFPKVETRYILRIDKNRNVDIWSTHSNPQEYLRAQPFHRLKQP